MILDILIWNILLMLIRGADKTIQESNEESELLHFHHQLYMNHCGDIVTCDTDKGHPEPPIDYVTPVPCCLPCPCMQSCSSKHACCPGFDFEPHNDSSFFFEAIDGMPTTYHDNQDITTPTKSHITTRRELQHIYTTKSALDQHHGHSSKLAARLGETTTKATVPSPSYARCIRPQVFNRPNTYIDSKAYRIVEVCFQDNKMVDYCYGNNVSKVLTEMIPITSRRTGITYLNRFCLQCNEGDVIDENLADVWEAQMVHYKIGYDHRFVFHPDELVDNIITVFTGYVNIHFVPGPRTRNLVQQCETYDIISCNKTGLWETYDKNVEKVCHDGHSLPVLHLISYGHNNLRFKNIACVYCNLGDSFNMNTTLSCGYLPVPTAKSYSQTLNIKIEEITKEKEEFREKQFLSNTVRAILPVPNTDVCPTGYIALLGYCRRVICPRDYYVLKGKCVPLYRSITGVDINVKIEIALKDENPTELFSDVLIELRKVVNISLAKCVTLQSRKMSVWYGPKGSKDRDKYFMFDIFLFNSSGTIDFSASLNEIREFYNNLKAQDSIRLLNGDEKKLEINFNDRVIPMFRQYMYNDMSINGDGSLRILMGRKLEELDGRPSTLVSNVNWCYRVPFDTLDETVMIGKDVYFIKPADIIVYKNQFDKINKAVPEEIHLLYLCLDLFISHINERNSDKTSYDPTRLKSNTDDENIDMTFSTPVNIIITAAALGLCLVCALCKIHYKSMKPTLQSVIQASPDTGIVSDVGMTEDGTQHIEMAGENLGLDTTNADADSSETETNSKDVPDMHYHL